MVQGLKLVDGEVGAAWKRSICPSVRVYSDCTGHKAAPLFSHAAVANTAFHCSKVRNLKPMHVYLHFRCRHAGAPCEKRSAERAVHRSSPGRFAAEHRAEKISCLQILEKKFQLDAEKAKHLPRERTPPVG